MKHYYCYVDVDGVLNSDNFAARMIEEDNYNPFMDDYLDIQAIRNLRHIIKETGAKIILSSSWRWDKDAYDAVKKQLAIVGLEIFDCTNMDIRINMNRTQEIEEHIKANIDRIKNYVILDDDIIKEPLDKHWVRCTFKEGLTHKLAEQAVEILLDRSMYEKGIF